MIIEGVEWQPARVNLNAHKEGYKTVTLYPEQFWASEEAVEKVEQQTVLYRPVMPGEAERAIKQYREMGCDATQFFMIHYTKPTTQEVGSVACQHELLAD